MRSGAKPVLIDSDPNTWNMDIKQIELKISEKTKAIMVVHIYGLPVDMDPVLDLCKKYKLKLIEDTAEVIGQTYKNRPCGSFGDISTVSFYSNKHITTGEGGMILTDDDKIAENCREMRNLYFNSKRRFVHHKLGWNLRMTNIQAALGLAQLERLDEFVEKKRWIGNKYNNLLKNLGGVQLPLKKTDFSINIYWVYGLVLDDNLNFDSFKVMKNLLKNNIGCRPFFYPLHQQPVFTQKKLFKGERYPVAERLYKKGFYLPSGLALTDKQITRVADQLIKIFRTMKAE